MCPVGEEWAKRSRRGLGKEEEREKYRETEKSLNRNIFYFFSWQHGVPLLVKNFKKKFFLGCNSER